MKISSILLCAVPSAALVVELGQNPAIVSTASADSLPSASSSPLEAPTLSIAEGVQPQQQDGRRVFRVAGVRPDNVAVLSGHDDAASEAVVDQWPEPARGSIGLGALETAPGSTKSLRARSEGTLGQTPWIGMAIGLTCTALAAVMLG
ncbi:uncharacterized protein ACLA_075140 [Aspergillus clavatus NRRL 1]|uniref:GPI anchored protein n=1 Tax=Aspergillus clavatus (strain ATCC 1007 / CBS 513.65 / DSM 816 / NCTC 3887 / NRRL 1 / QM 1276 / 107) TaxID=344612 RepID=A1C7V5_ASPCL|nr:uncharacterized protein ACLA_075140 [Aspergillus clavatus NRRL 1]EAW14476.1 conserved hypothetical protein [Aspergillus clavatus NRRL 1]